MKRAHIVIVVTFMLLANGAGAEIGVKEFHLDEATVGDVQAAYRSGAITATRLVQHYLERIQAYDQAGPKLVAEKTRLSRTGEMVWTPPTSGVT
jgi:hypothetical protein